MKFVQLIKNVLFEKNGQTTLPVVGHSMYPSLKANTRVTVYPSKKITPGQCCVYLKNNILVIHRFLFGYRCWAYVAGDNNTMIEKIAAETIIGIAEFNESLTKKVAFTIVNYLFLPLNKTALFKFRLRIVNRIFQWREIE